MNGAPGALPVPVDAARTATVALDLVQDWFHSLRTSYSEEVLDQCLKQAGIVKGFIDRPGARLTRDQLVRLYQESAKKTGDEMMGFWTRPIRSGALKYIMRTVRDAPSINVALYRFTQFWNLLLDDFSLNLIRTDKELGIELVPRYSTAVVHRFGHALMLKFTHGIVSWLVGREVPVQQVAFAFARPAFAADYSVLFPASVCFDVPCSHILFQVELGQVRPQRTQVEARAFLERAPRDWIFTSYREHALRLKVREILHADLGHTLEDVSGKLHMSARTLIRRLQEEGLSFQGIKDELRRDLAIFKLLRKDMSLAEIAYALKFSSPATFHRAFRHWTGMTPGVYRAAQQELT